MEYRKCPRCGGVMVRYRRADEWLETCPHCEPANRASVPSALNNELSYQGATRLRYGRARAYTEALDNGIGT